MRLTMLHKILLAALAVQIVLLIVVRTRSGDDVPVVERPLLAAFDPAAVTDVKVFGDGHDKVDVALVKRGSDWVIAPKSVPST